MLTEHSVNVIGQGLDWLPVIAFVQNRIHSIEFLEPIDVYILIGMELVPV